MRSNAFRASGSYASYSRYRTLRPALWLRTRPRNVATAPSDPLPCPDRRLTSATSGSSANGALPTANSVIVSSIASVFLVRPRHHDGCARGVEELRRSVHIVERDGFNERRQAAVVVEPETEELGGLQEVGNAGVGLQRARHRADQELARFVQFFGRQAVSRQGGQLLVDCGDRPV